MENLAFNQLNFTAYSNGLFIIDESLKKLCQQNPARILDLGCGVGTNLLEAAKIFPSSEFVGVDISENNIQTARKDISNKNLATKISFETCDYLNFQTKPFDIIYAESVLHLISTEDKKLYQKIATDLQHDGLLVVTMPYDCLYNRILFQIRKTFRALRNKYIDKLILTVAKRIYPTVDIKVLEDRIPYMYLIPHRIDSQSFRQLLENQYQLKVVQSTICKSTSLAKPKHKLIVFRKI